MAEFQNEVMMSKYLTFYVWVEIFNALSFINIQSQLSYPTDKNNSMENIKQ